MGANTSSLLHSARAVCCTLVFVAGCHADGESAALAAMPAPQGTLVESTASIPGDGLRPGRYATEGGWGQLSIDGTPVSTFTLDTESGGDGCALAGRLEGRRGIVDGIGGGAQCVLEIAPADGVLAVDTLTAEACAALCGANSSVRGRYRALPAGCAPGALASTRADFKRRYDSKAYAQAAALLARPFRECIVFLPLVEEGGLRNDYALALHRVGDDAGCVEALDKYRIDAMRSDEEIEQGMAPSVVGDYLAVIGAARVNLALCSAGRPIQEAGP